jgi:glycosyltransferase involved in cell wall biosynthesis
MRGHEGTQNNCLCAQHSAGELILTNTHNFAIQFARAGWRTTWLPKPATPLNFFRQAPVVGEKYGIKQQRLSFLFNYGGKGFNSFKVLWDVFPYFPWRPGRAAWREAGLLQPDIFFTGSLETASLGRVLKPKAMVYNAHDAFSLYPAAPASIRAIEAQVVQEATLTVTTAEMTRELLLKQYQVAPERVINLGQGVENERYAQALKMPEPSELQAIPRPRVVFLGTLDEQDVGLTGKVVTALPQASFIFIGTGGHRLKQQLKHAGNVHFLGPIYQERLPSLLIHCDVGLIAYDSAQRDARRYGTNPMKRYDYSAAGMQIVSVDLLEYEKNPSAMYVAKSPEEFVESARQAAYSPRFSRDQMRELASANDWKLKYEALLERLKSFDAV